MAASPPSQLPRASVATHSMTAVYGGDTDFTGATSPVDTVTVTQAATTTALSAGSRPERLRAIRKHCLPPLPPLPQARHGNWLGELLFDGATLLGSATLSGGVATFTTAALGVGSHALTAVYGGVASFTGRRLVG